MYRKRPERKGKLVRASQREVRVSEGSSYRESTVYIYRERILHDRAEIRNFSSSVEKYFTSERSEGVKYFSTREEKFRISKAWVKRRTSHEPNLITL